MNHLHMISIILSLTLISISCLIIWRSSHGFELGADFLGRKLPAGIKGATINAIASSMPEFLTTIFFLFYLRDADGFSGGLGVSSGSALFNLLIIPAMAVLMLVHMKRKERITLNKKILLREGLVLLLSQFLFIAFLFHNDLNAINGLVLVLVYMAYLGVLFMISKRGKKVDPGFETPKAKRELPWALRIITLDISSVFLKGNPMTAKRAWILLVISTLVMSAGTWILVKGTDLFGDATSIPLIFVSVVLSAAATSVPDTILSMKDAKKGNYDDAISNALGSNIFDIAFALGLPILLYNLIYGHSISLPPQMQDFTQEVWIFLLLSTIRALVIMLWGKQFTRGKAWLLLGIYFLFILFVGTQVNKGFSSIGDPIKHFLTFIADWLGDLLY